MVRLKPKKNEGGVMKTLTSQFHYGSIKTGKVSKETCIGKEVSIPLWFD